MSTLSLPLLLQDKELMEMENNEIGEEPNHSLVLSIDALINSVPQMSVECCIYNAPKIQRRVNEEAYTPVLVSIGPLHHGSPFLRHMEVNKLRSLKSFLDHESGRGIEYYVEGLRGLEENARLCYRELPEPHLTSDEFVKMMLLDGCFIIDFLLKFSGKKTIDDIDCIFAGWVTSYTIFFDWMLIENQLPFFVIENLFNLINGPDQRYWKFPILKFFIDSWGTFVGKLVGEVDPSKSISQAKHFVDLIRQLFIPTSATRMPPKEEKPGRAIPSATELSKAGVKFKTGTSNSFLDVTFIDGVLNIPHIIVNVATEGIFRNLIAYESFDKHPHYISDYAKLMDDLITTPDDVALLRECGIIISCLGQDEHVSLLFNNLRKGVAHSQEFYYACMYEDIDAYYRTRWHQLMATLKQDYFNTPWAIISFFAALLLLTCTIIQAVCSVIKY